MSERKSTRTLDIEQMLTDLSVRYLPDRQWASDMMPPEPDYAPALIGHTKPRHPHIFALIRAISNGINKIIVEEDYGDNDDGMFGSYGDEGVPLRHIALDRFRTRLWRLTAGWESQPIWDQAKRAEIRSEFDARMPRTITWTTSQPTEFRAFHVNRDEAGE